MKNKKKFTRCHMVTCAQKYGCIIGLNVHYKKDKLALHARLM